MWSIFCFTKIRGLHTGNPTKKLREPFKYSEEVLPQIRPFISQRGSEAPYAHVITTIYKVDKKKHEIHVGMWLSYPSAAVYILGVVLNPEPPLCYRINIKLV